MGSSGLDPVNQWFDQFDDRARLFLARLQETPLFKSSKSRLRV
jgi:hypothetical protein